ncbi:HupE/UreJ family protein [Acaryochloris sp. IP29b_bin.137]|uniref:HupE/UreJ family protein n=1 Tax=Acaryochloris sp. IP29b_bin.137 TaxID=2969217 RepID=UPI002603110F|nr:HupE/UreJ family protein [Acaryochloris sp. IP29b_bin.137]
MRPSFLKSSKVLPRLLWISLGVVISLLLRGGIQPLLAHHDGASPPINGLWEGVVHPLMGLDHITLIFAVGLLAARKNGSLIWVFTSSALMGIAAGLLGIQFSTAGVAITLLLMGILLARVDTVATVIMVAGVAIAGFCQGYPHAALIETVSSSIQVNFLVSFTLVQLALGYATCGVNRRFLRPHPNLIVPSLGIGGIGLAYLGSIYLL